jgi:hypothetical protein
LSSLFFIIKNEINSYLNKYALFNFNITFFVKTPTKYGATMPGIASIKKKIIKAKIKHRHRIKVLHAKVFETPNRIPEKGPATSFMLTK